MVCPTCFCTSVTQVSDLDATSATSSRQWESCFTLGFGAVAGGNFRSRRQDRYRQWLTHKFGTWVDQFGTRAAWAVADASPGAPWASMSATSSRSSPPRPC